MNHSNDIAELAKALCKIQAEIKDAEKDTSGYGYKYADLSQVLSIIRPLASKYGVTYTQHPINDGENICVETLVVHESGQWMSSKLCMSLMQAKGMNSAQAAGSVISYIRRYVLTSIFGITQSDDDASQGQHKEAVQHKSNHYENKKTYDGTGSKRDYKPKDEPKPLTVEQQNIIHMLKIYFDEKDVVGVKDYWHGIDGDIRELIKPHMGNDIKNWVRKIVTAPTPEDYASV